VLRGRREAVTMDDLIRAANDGDRLASSIMSDAGARCGEALGIMLNLMGPSLVVLGGMMADSNDFMESARRTARVKALEKASRKVEIERTALDKLGAARGAASIVLNALFAPGDRNILALGDAETV
jgi:predicted NBD/HSP70 family sugar kinase